METFPNDCSQLHGIIGISSSTGCRSVIGPEAGASDRPSSIAGGLFSQSPIWLIRDCERADIAEIFRGMGRSSQAESLRVGARQ
jgi:hypothetical protein